jgi:hypothetical protein
VVSAGHGGDSGRNGVRLRLRHPGWLVLGEGYSRAWRATCRSANGQERELGAPIPIDGFANGWPVTGSCATADISFGPQRLAAVSYVVSALAGLAILVLLALPLWRRPAPAKVLGEPGGDPGDPAVRLAPRAAVALGVAVGLAGAWFFAVRAGVLLGAAVAVLTWTGVSSRRILWLAIPPLAVIPLLYVLAPSSGLGGFFGYADQHIAAHWLAVAAVCAIAAASLLDARRLRHASREEGRGP